MAKESKKKKIERVTSSSGGPRASVREHSAEIKTKRVKRAPVKKIKTLPSRKKKDV